MFRDEKILKGKVDRNPRQSPHLFSILVIRSSIRRNHSHNRDSDRLKQWDSFGNTSREKKRILFYIKNGEILLFSKKYLFSVLVKLFHDILRFHSSRNGLICCSGTLFTRLLILACFDLHDVSVSILLIKTNPDFPTNKPFKSLYHCKFYRKVSLLPIPVRSVVLSTSFPPSSLLVFSCHTEDP